MPEMNIDQLNSIACRGLFGLSFLLLIAAVSIRIVNAFGYTIAGQTTTGGRLLEVSGVLAVFVIALLLREIREELKNGATG